MASGQRTMINKEVHGGIVDSGMYSAIALIKEYVTAI